MGIGGSRVRALCDSGALRTTLGRVGLQIASECGKTITPHNERGARLADRKSVPILDHVLLPFDVAGVRCSIGVIIVDELETDCLLNADFMRKFMRVVEPSRDEPKVEWQISLLHRLPEIKRHHQSVRVPATSDGCDTAQVAKCERISTLDLSSA